MQLWKLLNDIQSVLRTLGCTNLQCSTGRSWPRIITTQLSRSPWNPCLCWLQGHLSFCNFWNRWNGNLANEGAQQQPFLLSATSRKNSGLWSGYLPNRGQIWSSPRCWRPRPTPPEGTLHCKCALKPTQVTWGTFLCLRLVTRMIWEAGVEEHEA